MSLFTSETSGKANEAKYGKSYGYSSSRKPQQEDDEDDGDDLEEADVRDSDNVPSQDEYGDEEWEDDYQEGELEEADVTDVASVSPDTSATNNNGRPERDITSWR
jgi:hypothetical protein